MLHGNVFIIEFVDSKYSKYKQRVGNIRPLSPKEEFGKIYCWYMSPDIRKQYDVTDMLMKPKKLAAENEKKKNGHT